MSSNDGIASCTSDEVAVSGGFDKPAQNYPFLKLVGSKGFGNGWAAAVYNEDNANSRSFFITVECMSLF